MTPLDLAGGGMGGGFMQMLQQLFQNPQFMQMMGGGMGQKPEYQAMQAPSGGNFDVMSRLMGGGQNSSGGYGAQNPFLGGSMGGGGGTPSFGAPEYGGSVMPPFPGGSANGGGQNSSVGGYAGPLGFGTPGGGRTY
jgi:hypothetical protein